MAEEEGDGEEEESRMQWVSRMEAGERLRVDFGSEEGHDGGK